MLRQALLGLVPVAVAAVLSMNLGGFSTNRSVNEVQAKGPFSPSHMHSSSHGSHYGSYGSHDSS